MSVVHDFRECLARGEAASEEPFWEQVYRRAFPTMAGMLRNDARNEAQYRGIDRLILLGNGQTLTVDEKRRDREYDDILLEYLANDRTGAPGWIEKDLAIDYLAYAFIRSERCYLFPWPMLRRSWLEFGDYWKQRFPIVPARNRDYTTYSVAVPIKDLQRAVVWSQLIDLKTPQSAKRTA